MKATLHPGSRSISRNIGWINIISILLAAGAVADSSFISVPLQRTGADANAGGVATINLGQTTSSMNVLVSNVAPSRPCTVFVAGVERGRFVPNRNGRGQLKLTQPTANGVNQFNFDPRDRQLVVAQGGSAVLRARISGPNEPAGTIMNEHVTIPRIAGPGTNGAQSTYELRADGGRRFTVTLTNVADGAWTVFVDGIRRGTINVANGFGAVALDNSAATPEPALGFDPRGRVVDIALGTALRFSGLMEARANGINVARPSVVTRFIPPTGTATGFARLRRFIEPDARRRLVVELVDVPVGEYQLVVNDVIKGTIPVGATSTGARGEIQFASEPDDEDELPLNFNALNSFYIVQGAGTFQFQGQPVTDALGDTNTPAFTPVRFSLPLFNLGEDRDAISRLQFKRDENGSRHFEVVVKNVPTGFYFLTMNGVPRATIFVTATENRTRGFLEFEDSPEPGEDTLTFDPLGKTVGIERDGTRFFERTLTATP